MDSYTLPDLRTPPIPAPRTAYLIASGDLRHSANVAGWPTQSAMEESLTVAFAGLGWTVIRAHPVDGAKGHGFIDSQRMGLTVFRDVPPTAPVIVAEAVWQYSHHVLPGLQTHRGPILTVANFVGEWPGLVGLLGLNGGLTKMNKAYSTIWSTDFTDDVFLRAIQEWVTTGFITHDTSHVTRFLDITPGPERELGEALGRQLLSEKAIIGVFDEGCMGMHNAIIGDELLNAIGIYKERLSQSALYAEMLTVPDAETEAVKDWLDRKGMRFALGTDERTELTPEQLRWQFAMYIAAVRIADDYGVDAVGIQYQQGLRDLVPASDLAEGLLNNVDRPPVLSRDGSRVLWEGQALPHFNEVDECVAVDALITNRVWRAMNLDPATTLHDIRWGEERDGQFVWVFEISGAVPASHLRGGYEGAISERQSPVYFPLGGGTLKGVSRAGEIVWSRVFIMDGVLQVDIGRGRAIDLPDHETERRWNLTTREWPIMHAVIDGVSRDQMMARHKANHIQVAYANSPEEADRALIAKAAFFSSLGVVVNLCGKSDGNSNLTR